MSKWTKDGHVPYQKYNWLGVEHFLDMEKPTVVTFNQLTPLKTAGLFFRWRSWEVVPSLLKAIVQDVFQYVEVGTPGVFAMNVPKLTEGG